VLFKLSEKQPIVLILGVFEKVENCFGWLTCCQPKTIDCFVLSIDFLFENPNKICFVSWVCFKWFSNWMHSCFKCFDQSLKALNSLLMFYKKQEKHIWVFQFERDCFQDLIIHYSALIFSRESGIGLHLYWFQFIL